MLRGNAASISGAVQGLGPRRLGSASPAPWRWRPLRRTSPATRSAPAPRRRPRSSSASRTSSPRRSCRASRRSRPSWGRGSHPAASSHPSESPDRSPSIKLHRHELHGKWNYTIRQGNPKAAMICERALAGIASSAPRSWIGNDADLSNEDLGRVPQVSMRKKYPRRR